MINVMFSTDKKSGSLSMTAVGHAGAGEKGKDIICAGISTLAFTIAQCVTFMHSEGKLKKKPHINIRDGNMTVTATPKGDDYAEALHTFYVAQVGIHLIAKNYPKHVSLIPFDSI